MAKLGDWLWRGMLAPFRALLPKNPWLRGLVVAAPFVLLLAFFGPALDALVRLVELFLRLLDPLLQTTVGRVLLLVVSFSLGGALVAWLLQGRVRDLRGEAVLGRHLQAVAALVGHDPRRGRERFRRVARYRGPLPGRYPHVVADANLKLARLELAAGRADAALGWLVRVIEPGLPTELRRSLRQLRLQALAQQGEVLPQTLLAEARTAVAEFATDPVLLGLLRDLLPVPAALAERAELQGRIVAVAPPAEAAAAREAWIDDLVALGQDRLQGDDFDAVRKVGKQLAIADPTGVASGLLQGDLLRRRGDLRGAVRAYGATRSPQGLDRLAELLREHPGTVEPRELLESCPLQGALLLVARELARRGERDRAERAARLAAESLGPTGTVCAVLAEVLELLGKDAQARLLREQAVARLLQAPPRPAG